MRPTRFLVISDLHLGGAPAGSGRRAFQICSAAGRARLAAFIGWAAGQRTADRDVHLVIAGDVVDFLAEERGGGTWAFTADDRRATEKLGAIMADTAEIWRRLRAFADGGGALTLMLGNHDLELSLPGPRRLLEQALGGRGVELLADGGPFARGRLVIEHGNRNDDLNAVSYRSLREQPETFAPPVGSHLVVDHLNPVKERRAFVDLLLPEGPAMLPFLALLEPVAFARMSAALGDHLGARPAILDAADEIAAAAAAGQARERLLDLVEEALRAFRDAHERAFDVGQEDERYLRAASETAGRGYQVVVYGHTHLPKRVPLAGRLTSTGGKAVYFNSGTWADVMAVPLDVLAPANDRPPGEARRRLAEFADDLAANRLETWRRQLPTFVRVDLDHEGRVVTAELELFDAEARSPIAVTTTLVRDRLRTGRGTHV